MIVPVILAGGSGTRLWPLSRHHYPKQLLSLLGEETLLQATATRLRGLEGLGSTLCICNEDHRFTVAGQLQAIGCKPGSIILEPEGRNTAPALAVAALWALRSLGSDVTLLVLPADHYMEDATNFRNAVKRGEALAEEGFLITFGVRPRSPETGYGYIATGAEILGGDEELDHGMKAYEIVEFIEKPNLELARSFVDSDRYYWNSGVFMFQAKKVVEELGRLTPSILDSCRCALDKSTVDLDFLRLDREAFCACPSDSIDYAIMEKTRNGAMVRLDSGWSDLGSWESLWQASEKDRNQNATSGNVFTHDVKNSLLYATSRMVAAVGIEDHVVIETPDAVLVSPRSRVQEVKLLVDHMRQRNLAEALMHRRVYRPWGSYESVDCSDRFQVKRITVLPGAKLSLQKHYHRSEHWVVVRGTALVTRGEEVLVLKEDESTYIPLGMVHRLENPGRIPLELIEVQTGSYLGEDDIARLEDVYGR